MADQTSFLKPILRDLVYGVDAWKKPVKAASATNITSLAGAQTLGGVACVSGDEALLVGQITASQNGIWTLALGAWVRRADADSSERLFAGTRVPVTHGTYAGAVYRLTTTGTIRPGVTSQVWEADVPVGGGVPTARAITAGAGLTGGGDLSADRTLNAVANADGSIVVNANDIQVGVISDAQHGVRGGGATHSVATTSVAGYMSGADKAKVIALQLHNIFVNNGAYTAAPGDVILADASAGDSVQLPPDSLLQSSWITVIGIASGTGCTVTADGADTILGLATNAVLPGQAKIYIGSGENAWAVFTGAY